MGGWWVVVELNLRIVFSFVQAEQNLILCLKQQELCLPDRDLCKPVWLHFSGEYEGEVLSCNGCPCRVINILPVWSLPSWTTSSTSTRVEWLYSQHPQPPTHWRSTEWPLEWSIQLQLQLQASSTTSAITSSLIWAWHSSAPACLTLINREMRQYFKSQAGAELCQAQIKLEVIVDVVGEAWSWSWSCMLHSRGHTVLLRWVGGWLGMLRI